MKRNDRCCWLGLIGLSLLWSLTGQAADNVRLHGALVAEPCVIPPGEEDITLDFGTIIEKYLYLNQRTNGKEFTLHLTECDLSIANLVQVTFSGNENPNLPGLLALGPDSKASGIGIGMETTDGKPLPLNKAGQKYQLAKGDNLVVFKTYVQGEPDAIKTQSIEPGSFSAVATFGLEYE